MRPIRWAQNSRFGFRERESERKTMSHIQQLKTRPTFADLLKAIATDETFSAVRKTELRRDIEAFCGWLDRAPGSLPADPRYLRPHVAALQIAVLGLSAKRLANVKSSVN